jgi:hypothetical protein
MKKTLLLCGVLLALAAPAFAQPYPPQIDLTWSDCPLGAFTVDASNACTNNTGSVGVMIASFAPPGALPLYEANISLLDLQTSAATLSAWWQMNSSGCRPTGMSISADFTSGPFSCSDFWAGQASTGMQYNVPGVLGPNSARINTVAGVQETGAGPIDENSMWYAYKLSLLKVKSVGTGACAGCLDGACIVLNQMNLSQPAPAPDVVLTSGPQNWVTYRGGAGAGHICPGATPNRKSTWGSVKALYR